MLKMNPDYKAKLLTALRSGDYVQGVAALHRVKQTGPDEWCCLGVAADQLPDVEWHRLSAVNSSMSCRYKDSNDSEYLNAAALELLGIYYDVQETLANMNDGNGDGDLEDLNGDVIDHPYTFEEIADQIERNL